MHNILGGSIIGGILFLGLATIVSRNPTVLSEVFGGGSQLLSVAMGGQYTGGSMPGGTLNPN